jgi:hypothetical protein
MSETLHNLALVWRIVLGLGSRSLPGSIMMVMRWRLHGQEAEGGVRVSGAVPLSEPEGDVHEDAGEEGSDGESGTILDSTPGDAENYKILSSLRKKGILSFSPLSLKLPLVPEKLQILCIFSNEPLSTLSF